MRSLGEQLTLDELEDDELGWHEWFMSLPRTPLATSAAPPRGAAPGHEHSVVSKEKRRAA
jgi:hypothetical protein